MTAYVLIILMASNANAYSHGDPAVSQQVYADIIACTKAGDAVNNVVKAMQVDDINRPAVTTVCTPEATPAK